MQQATYVAMRGYGRFCVLACGVLRLTLEAQRLYLAASQCKACDKFAIRMW
ncbi:hypothetical protein GCM10009615_04600 [Corynebacterium durum]